MGGYGSGSGRYGHKSTVEDTRIWRISLHDLQQRPGFSPQRGGWLDCEKGSEKWRVRLDFTCGPVGMYHGKQWYLRCPVCGRRVHYLYLPSWGRVGARAACRRCWKLCYSSQLYRTPKGILDLFASITGDMRGVDNLARRLRRRYA